MMFLAWPFPPPGAAVADGTKAAGAFFAEAGVLAMAAAAEGGVGLATEVAASVFLCR
jgi:hypothetical protein